MIFSIDFLSRDLASISSTSQFHCVTCSLSNADPVTDFQFHSPEPEFNPLTKRILDTNTKTNQ